MSEQRLESLMDRIYTAYGRDSRAVCIAGELREYIRTQQDKIEQLQAREARLLAALTNIAKPLPAIPSQALVAGYKSQQLALQTLASPEPGKGGGE